jgi:hypothetical protein
MTLTDIEEKYESIYDKVQLSILYEAMRTDEDGLARYNAENQHVRHLLMKGVQDISDYIMMQPLPKKWTAYKDLRHDGQNDEARRFLLTYVKLKGKRGKDGDRAT